MSRCRLRGAAIPSLCFRCSAASPSRRKSVGRFRSIGRFAQPVRHILVPYRRALDANRRKRKKTNDPNTLRLVALEKFVRQRDFIVQNVVDPGYYFANSGAQSKSISCPPQCVFGLSGIFTESRSECGSSLKTRVLVRRQSHRVSNST